VGVIGRALVAAFNLEDRSALVRALVGCAILGLAIAAALRLARAPARVERRPVLLAALGLALVFLGGTLPLAALPDWNAWRDWVPAMALGTGLGALLALASPWLLGGLWVVKLALLCSAPLAPGTVATQVPAADSHLSYPRLARLQRTVESTRRALLAAAPSLPRDAAVRYRWMPQHAAFAFQDSAAVRVWYADSTLEWQPYAPASALRADAVVEYLPESPWPARSVDRVAVDLFRHATRAFGERRFASADSLLAVAGARVHPGPFAAYLLDHRARCHLQMEAFARADSLNRRSLAMAENEPHAWVTAGVLAALAGDRRRAAHAVAMCLTLDPDHREGRELAARLARAP
jgi:hypothetical protein